MEVIVTLSLFLVGIFVVMAIDRWNARHPRHSHKAH